MSAPRLVTSSVALATILLAGVQAAAQPDGGTAAPTPAPAPTAPALTTDPVTTPPATTATEPSTTGEQGGAAAAAGTDAAAAPLITAAFVADTVDQALAKRGETAGWKDGFWVGTADGAFKLKIGGYTQFDGRFFVDDPDEKGVDQFAFRRIRPDLQGQLLSHYQFRLLPDFAGGKVVIQDAYVDASWLDALRFRAGKFKEPFGLERLQSATAILFVERAFPTALAPNRDLGIQVFGDVARGRLSWALGVFNGVADGGSTDGDTSDDKEVAARLFVTPLATGGPYVKNLGVGVAATFGDQQGTAAATDLPTLKTASQATFFAYRTGELPEETALADGRHWRATVQGHWYGGPFGILAELVHSQQEVGIGGNRIDVKSDAWQVAGNYVVIGGDASYKSVTPKTPFDPGDGKAGAVELAARYTELRVDEDAFPLLADPAKSARRARAFAGGVNWHASKHFKVALDFESTTFEGGAADGADRATENVVLSRVQTVF